MSVLDKSEAGASNARRVDSTACTAGEANDAIMSASHDQGRSFSSCLRSAGAVPSVPFTSRRCRFLPMIPLERVYPRSFD